MSQRDFDRFSSFIYSQCGVYLPPAKKVMLGVRLNKRLRALGLQSFSDYFDYLRGPRGEAGELVHFIDTVTTNKTDFFREPNHFDILRNKVLPQLFQRKKTLRVWSAGCSTGEEPYTLAMVLADFFERAAERANFSILATDISTHVLAVAEKGVYGETDIKPIPLEFRKKFLLRGKGSQEGLFRMVPQLRNKIRFVRLNLNEGDAFGIKSLVDVLFCRNVVIYFDRQTQKRLFAKFYSQIRGGGYLFVGHSESLHSINDHFVLVAPSVYQKPL
jgi:chemotaxis protein methyltransferase CheR